ncbi:MAG: AIR synthase-related protein [Patescibacteria group bacterium]|nr:AIR synthase-related protein [Patescibacteria group bacterium]
MVKQIIVYTTGEQSAKVYTIDKKLSNDDYEKIGQMLINSVIQSFEVKQMSSAGKSGWWAEIGFLPGVTDNAGMTAQEGIEDLLKIKFKSGEKVYSSELVFSKKKLKEISANPLVQRTSFNCRLGMPKVNLNSKNKVVLENKVWALDERELQTIRGYFKQQRRRATEIEMESIAQTWSEHCKHKIFQKFFRQYIRAATKKIDKKLCASVFTDNSGAIEFDKNWLITHKVETHNSPSALDPFGGAVTGIVGVNRDALGFGLGAKPIINTYGFCFGKPNNKQKLFRDQKLTRPMLSTQQIINGVIQGVNSGGNCSGIPTSQGFVFYDDSFRGKPLVFVGTVGLIPKKYLTKKALAGDYIIIVGGRVGADGIHGATFSSECLNSESPLAAVQIGDPITQKKLSDVLVKEARDLNLYHSITDNGAGGLSCSVAEMAKESGGFVVNLEKVPLKYQGLEPWQIWISESQERMTLAVPASKWQKFKDLLIKRGVEATVIGKFTDTGRAVVKFNNKKIMDLSMKFLHNGWPRKILKTSFIKKDYPEQKLIVKNNLTIELKQLLSQLNIKSYEFISKQYDHEVQGGSVIKPLQGVGKINGETTVTRPLLSSNKGVVLSQGAWPSYGLIDSYQMAANSLDTAVRNCVSVGADFKQIALLDNFCWCSSDEPQRLGELEQAAKACYDLAVIYKTPFISGKDSMFNDFSGFDENGRPIKISVLPTLLISAIGMIEEVTKAVSIDFKFPGDLIYILGETRDGELGGSEYYRMKGYIGNQVPQVQARENNKLYQALSRAMKQRLIASSISVTRGGLAVALAKSALAGGWGLKVNLNCSEMGLFSESSGRIVVTVNLKNKFKFEKIMAGNNCELVGKVVQGSKIIINDFINLSLSEAMNAYKS